MKTIKFCGIVAIAIAITSCASSSSEKATEDAHDSTVCTEHNHSNCAEGHHSHGKVVIGVAQEGDYASGKITITTIPGCEPKEFDYSKSNQDQIAAWQAGDTVSIFIDCHNHGGESCDSVVAIKFGVKECTSGHNHEEHENCDGHDHSHKH